MGCNSHYHYYKNNIIIKLWTCTVCVCVEHCMTAIEQVHLIIHLPPGYLETDPVYWFRPELNTAFNQLIRRHASTIVGMYGGHGHTDSFRIYYDNGTVPLSFASGLALYVRHFRPSD